MARLSGPRAFVAAAIRMEMLRRGWLREDIATRTGFTPDTVTNIICGNICSPVSRRKVELAFGTPFWAGPTEFAAHQRLRDFFGVDPALTSLRQARALARNHLGRGFSRASRKEIARRLKEHFADTQASSRSGRKTKNRKPATVLQPA